MSRQTMRTTLVRFGRLKAGKILGRCILLLPARIASAGDMAVAEWMLTMPAALARAQAPDPSTDVTVDPSHRRPQSPASRARTGAGA